MSYKLKYLKYKNKYFVLKQNIYDYSQNSNLSQYKLEQMNKNKYLEHSSNLNLFNGNSENTNDHIIGGGGDIKPKAPEFTTKEEKAEYDLIKAGFTKEIAKTIIINELMDIDRAITLMNYYIINHRNSPPESPEIISNKVYNKLNDEVLNKMMKHRP